MEGLPNRKKRREWARQAGMLKQKQNANFKELIDIINRSIEVGKQIHLNNTEKVLREQEKQKNEIRAKKLEELLNKGFSQEEALNILDKD